MEERPAHLMPLLKKSGLHGYLRIPWLPYWRERDRSHKDLSLNLITTPIDEMKNDYIDIIDI